MFWYCCERVKNIPDIRNIYVSLVNKYEMSKDGIFRVLRRIRDDEYLIYQNNELLSSAHD
jgi:hypothetical protein